MILLLTHLEPNEKKLLHRLETDEQILNDVETLQKLFNIALKWEEIIIKRGNIELNKYQLRSMRINRNLYDFLLCSREINEVFDYINAGITVFGNLSVDEFGKFMLKYDPNFEQ
jgi:hypothetical protein